MEAEVGEAPFQAGGGEAGQPGSRWEFGGPGDQISEEMKLERSGREKGPKAKWVPTGKYKKEN